RANMNLADTTGSGNTSSTPTAVLNFNGHPIDIMANTIILGRRTAGSTGGVSGNLSFDTGTLDANQIQMAIRSAGGTANATLTVGGTGHLNVGNSGISLANGAQTNGTLTINDLAVAQINGDVTRDNGGNANINVAGTLDLLNLDTGSSNDHNLANPGSPVDT